MAPPRFVVELAIGEEDVTKLIAITRSRTKPASRVERARMLLAYALLQRSCVLCWTHPALAGTAVPIIAT